MFLIMKIAMKLISCINFLKKLKIIVNKKLISNKDKIIVKYISKLNPLLKKLK